MDPPETCYLKTSDQVYIAYQVAGAGPVDVAVGFNSNESNVDLMWEEPEWGPFLSRLARYARVIMHDRRGTGVSSRNVSPPNLETQVSDLLTVLDQVGSRRPILAAGTDSGAMHALFAASHPDRAAALLWNNPVARRAWAEDYPWGATQEQFEADMERSRVWGTPEDGRRQALWRTAQRIGVSAQDILPKVDRERLNAYAKIIRNTATPDVAEQICRIDYDTDVRGILSSVRAPTTLVSGEKDALGGPDEARYIASLMPNATVRVLKGSSGVATEEIVDILRKLAGVESQPELRTVLSTVLFTDIVGSTALQAALGDRRWKDLVLAHHGIVRAALARWQGLENDTAGDGFYATFDGPARAIRCALEICERVAGLGIEVRAGVHSGECEVIDGKCGGLTVGIGARITSFGRPSEVLVSQTVKDLVAGSGIRFEDRGIHELKGVPDRWRLYRVLPGGPPGEG